MRILVYLGHPAHFHLYKNVIKTLQNHNHQVDVLIKKKDVLELLLQTSNIEYSNILPEGRKDSKLGILWGMIKRTWRLWEFCKKRRPDILTGTSVENSFVGKMMRIPVINLNEDDAQVVPLYTGLSYPWASTILVPEVCNCGKWDALAIKYQSYHELAYLHPNHFIPNKEVVNKYIHGDNTYFLIRFAKLTAHHDNGIQGINEVIAQKIIDMLIPYGSIYITSERDLEPQFEKYRIKIPPIDMHHVMAFAQFYIGDSQTMAAEAGVLGVPFIRFNNFVGKIGYLKELEEVYHLGYGINSNEVEQLYTTIDKLLKEPDLKAVFQEKRRKMLSDKINYADFLVWFLESYPDSKSIMKNKPAYQFCFK